MKKLLSLCLVALFAVACQKDVQPRPTADFTYTTISSTATEQVIQFTNTSINADRFQWLTSGNVAVTDRHIILHYTENGRKTVSLTAKNDVGEDTKTQSIDIVGIATTGSVIFWTQFGDKGDIEISINNSLQGKITQYVTNGVAPSCGLQGFVTVTLSPGSYSYSAKSGGLFPLRWNGTINVVRGKCSTFQLTK